MSYFPRRLSLHYAILRLGKTLTDTVASPIYHLVRVCMSTKTTIPQNVSSSQGEESILPTSVLTPLRERLLVLALALIAFLPRLLLATKLDMVTDEVVYIVGGKIYVPLLAHLQIGTSQWSYNYEHPPFVKLLIGVALALNTALNHPLPELLTARFPSILMGTLLIVTLYWLGRAPFGRAVALTAALCLALSPWLVYFSALAYLDMTMTALVSTACLLSWHALRRPWLYPILTLCLALGAASKYTAVLVIPGIALFTAYYFFIIRLYMPATQRPRIPWLWWLAAIIAAPIAFFIVDPAIWPDPVSLLLHSFRFEWNHSVNGHLTFLAGRYAFHVPRWAILYIVFTKMSAFVTISAAGFMVYGSVQLIRFHLRKITPTAIAPTAFLFFWLFSIIGAFSLLNIVVGTHYHLPIAPPIAFAASVGLVQFLHYLYKKLPLAKGGARLQYTQEPRVFPSAQPPPHARFYPTTTAVLLVVALVLPHLIGLTTTYGAEGYTSEFFNGENRALQVAYPGYREALQWIATQTQGTEHVGLAAVPGTFNSQGNDESWYSYNRDLPSRLQLNEVHAGETYTQYDYLVWPMHLVQRGFPLPDGWRKHNVHRVLGGQTIYCYILARPTTTYNG